MKYYSIFILFFVLIVSCKQRQQPVVTPWGETITMEQDNDADADSLAAFDLDQTVHAGELIALTISGPTTCYDYRGTRLGLHAMLCQRLADTLGIRLRLEICRDTTELMARLQSGDGDLAAYPLLTNDSLGWLIPTEKPLLQEAVHQWFSPSLLSLVQKEEQQLLRSGGGVKRHVYAPMLNSNEGIISRYDALFQRYCQPIRWDWRLMAAQCYQESTFDPNALSFAGARGLMQIMPQTADHLQLPRSQLNNPEQNIAAASRYLAELEHTFADVPSRHERQNFVLAAYNGGAHHIRDAMALARRDGRNQHSWDVVSGYVQLLSNPQYYQDPVVQHGYMRGYETVGYVRLIRQRYQQYKGVKAKTVTSTPQKSRNEKHRNKFHL